MPRSGGPYIVRTILGASSISPAEETLNQNLYGMERVILVDSNVWNGSPIQISNSYEKVSTTMIAENQRW